MIYHKTHPFKATHNESSENVHHPERSTINIYNPSTFFNPAPPHLRQTLICFLQCQFWTLHVNAGCTCFQLSTTNCILTIYLNTFLLTRLPGSESPASGTERGTLINVVLINKYPFFLLFVTGKEWQNLDVLSLLKWKRLDCSQTGVWELSSDTVEGV